MSEIDSGHLSTSKMELAVTIINDSPIYANSPTYSQTPAFIIYYPDYCYALNSKAFAIILLSLLYLFASKSGKICTNNSIYSFSYLFFLLYLWWFSRSSVNFCKFPMLLPLLSILQLYLHRHINKIKIL